MTRDPGDETPPEALRHLVSAPRFALLRWGIECLERAGLPVALGGSGLYLASRGAEPRVRAELLAQPLASGIAARLAALPTSSVA